MNAITYKAAKANLSEVMERVCLDREPLVITCSSRQPVVMLTHEDFRSIEETALLLRGAKNVRRLISPIAN